MLSNKVLGMWNDNNPHLHAANRIFGHVKLAFLYSACSANDDWTCETCFSVPPGEKDTVHD